MPVTAAGPWELFWKGVLKKKGLTFKHFTSFFFKQGKNKYIDSGSHNQSMELSTNLFSFFLSIIYS